MRGIRLRLCKIVKMKKTPKTALLNRSLASPPICTVCTYFVLTSPLLTTGVMIISFRFHFIL